MDIKMVDITVHIDETLDRESCQALDNQVRSNDGVLGIGHLETQPHLMMVEYDPEKLTSMDILQVVKNQGVHAELLGL